MNKKKYANQLRYDGIFHYEYLVVQRKKNNLTEFFESLVDSSDIWNSEGILANGCETFLNSS